MRLSEKIVGEDDILENPRNPRRLGSQRRRGRTRLYFWNSQLKNFRNRRTYSLCHLL
jgi:hypothetical protein